MEQRMTIGLDVDGVLANFSQAFIERARAMGLGEHFPPHWTLWNRWMFGGANFTKVWDTIKHDNAFWYDEIQPRDTAYVPFPVQAYVTHRPVPSEVTAKWLRRHGFPDAPVITVSGSKVEAVRAAGIDVFVDDKAENFQELNDAGIYCLLYDAPHNGDVDDRIHMGCDDDSCASVSGRAHYLSDVPILTSILEGYGRRLSV